ncbi:hypothetical protein OAK91_02885 [Planctomycetaceae bacterium]|nr:hypothetical protein [Planctomycetaceae bacterium]
MSKPPTELAIVDSIEGAENLTGPQRLFIDAYCETLSVTHAATIAGISRQAHYLNVARSHAYKKIFDQAAAIAIKGKISQWVQEAHSGQTKYKFDRNGEPIKHPETGEPYTEREIPWIPRIFLMKALGNMSDQPPARTSNDSKVNVHIYFPNQESSSPQILEVNHHESEGTDMPSIAEDDG